LTNWDIELNLPLQNTIYEKLKEHKNMLDVELLNELKKENSEIAYKDMNRALLKLEIMNYYINKTIKADFKQAVQLVTEALKTEGFGVLSEIDIQQKLKEKLDVDFRKYKILGACNPPNAYKALQQEDKIGTMLPCNVILQQLDDNQIEVAAVDPVASMMAVENKELAGIANNIKEKLERVIASL